MNDRRDPIVCSLDGPSVKRRLLEFRELLSRGFLGGERTVSGVRWRFANQPAKWEDLQALAAREQECCRFFRFRLQVAGSEIWWDTEVQAGAEPILEEFFRLPSELAAADQAGGETTARFWPGHPGDERP